MVVRVGEVGNGTDGDKNWEFEKRSKHFSFGDHFINFHNFLSCFCMDTVFDIGHSWDLKGYTCMIVRLSVAWIRLLLTVTWQSVWVVYLQLWFILSAYLLSHHHKLIYKRNPWLPWQKYAARSGDVVRLLRTLGLVEWRHVLAHVVRIVDGA